MRGTGAQSSAVRSSEFSVTCASESEHASECKNLLKSKGRTATSRATLAPVKPPKRTTTIFMTHHNNNNTSVSVKYSVVAVAFEAEVVVVVFVVAAPDLDAVAAYARAGADKLVPREVGEEATAVAQAHVTSAVLVTRLTLQLFKMPFWRNGSVRTSQIL